MRDQRGYLSVLLLPLLTALLLLTLALINNGKQLRQRFYQQTIADNLAISAAVLMAREMNILALMNRALLANQLSIAQLVGISSWYQMLANSSSQTATVTAWVPYLNVLTQQFDRAVQSIERPLTQLLSTGISLHHGLLRGIMAGQTMVRLSYATLIPKTVGEIAALHELNDVPWRLLHAPGLFEFPLRWWSYIPRKRSGDDEQQLATLMQHSLDPFSQQRSYDWLRLGLVTVRKAGGTELDVTATGSWNWQALDTVSLHTKLLWFRFEIPWGVGANYLENPIHQLQASEFGASKAINSRASRLALRLQRQLGGQAPTMHYYHRANIHEQLPEVLVVIDTAIAKAGVFFSRPQELFPRTDQRDEQANLFNALWQSRLQSLTSRDKAVLMALKEAS
ncbi:hypothetical protein [Pseudidiomarina mangrovi]|uniref:hypothetical protein n=1 Tax=Pseudidiomarina mangrovi TaxID=2487133 RepID=UPI000FCA148D|nr:hypothetical protein [Pseudidiomarina mangrovi]